MAENLITNESLGKAIYEEFRGHEVGSIRLLALALIALVGSEFSAYDEANQQLEMRKKGEPVKVNKYKLKEQRRMAGIGYKTAFNQLAGEKANRPGFAEAWRGVNLFLQDLNDQYIDNNFDNSKIDQLRAQRQFWAVVSDCVMNLEGVNK